MQVRAFSSAAGGALAWAIACALSTSSSLAQNAGPCSAAGAELVHPPEIVRDDARHIVKGTIYLYDERHRLATRNDPANCSPQLVRSFRLEPPREPRNRDAVGDPMPGPTLRARVGDLVQLTFINQIDTGRFERGLDIEKCTEVNNGEVYPKPFGDKYPNCLHASSTANIHFHGTHTNPNSTGDNVYLQIRPLPRNNQGRLTTTAAGATVGFNRFFADCVTQLKTAPLKYWPATWRDLPRTWTTRQETLLKAYQKQNPDQPLWDHNQAIAKQGGWPIYYIGAVPYCFALPDYPGPGSTPPVMGQLPGTHWYHAHKHGSTAINVMNGMTGAFIIEGKYDDDLDAAYGRYMLVGNRPWRARSQKLLVLNQLGTVPNVLSPGGGGGLGAGGVDFTVNGQRVPKVRMQPGEVQLWRIVNTSGRTAAYFVPPVGLEWRQLAQDGVQYDDPNYQASLNRPFYMAPANRVDLLVKAPATVPSAPMAIRVKNVMARQSVVSEGERDLFTVEIGGPAVTLDGKPAEMTLLPTAPVPPKFLTDITDDELRKGGSIVRTFDFNSKSPRAERQHTINGVQFSEPHAQVSIMLGAVEEWKVTNSTLAQIDHPLHIHINPFQVPEMFDPHEKFVDSMGNITDRYVFDPKAILAAGQCAVNPADAATWKPCHATKQGHWWDVFAIPAGVSQGVDPSICTVKEKCPTSIQPFVTCEGGACGVTIPGYYKMRSRFVDYAGVYVMHCHILIHEDRGMMFGVEVVRAAPPPPHH